MAAEHPHAPSPSDAVTQASISVVICAYTMARLPLLLRAIDSASAQSRPPTEIVVVADHNDELAAEVQRRRPAVVVVPNGGIRGLSGARNAGVDAARGEFIAFLDDDAEADSRWLEHLDACFADPAVFVAGGTVLPSWATRRAAWFPEEFDWVIGCSYRGQLDPRHLRQGTPCVPVRNVIGASMLFRREVFEQVGGFRTDLGRVGEVPVGGEETELCIRVGATFGSASVVLAQHAIVHHHVPDGRLSWDYFRRRCYAEGLSKAVLSKIAGRRSSLSSETSYVLRTVPGALLRNLGSTLKGDAWSLRRSIAIVGGAWTTAWGWLVGTLTPRR